VACGRAAENPSLERIQVIALRGPESRLDHLAIDTRRGRLFIANMANSSLDVVDLTQGRPLRQIPEQRGIQGIAYDPDLDHIFVGNGKDGVLNVFDGRDYRLLKALPFPDADNVRYQEQSRLVYVAHAEKAIGVVDAATLRVRAEIALPDSPESFQLEKGRPRLYVNVPAAREVSVVDLSKHAVVGHFPLTQQANYPLALDEKGHRLFVGTRKKPMVLVIDTETGKELAAVPIPGDTDDLFYDAARKRVYVSCGEGVLAVLRETSRGSFEVEARIPTFRLARTSLFDPESGRLYLVVPRRPGTAGPEVWVYRASP
jgi:DNA-binding beta-propeller fold protein YncE